LTDEVLWKQAQKSALNRVHRFYRQDIFLQNYRNLYEEVM